MIHLLILLMIMYHIPEHRVLGSMVLFPITYVLCSFSNYLYTQAFKKWLPKLYCTVVHVLYTAADEGIDKDASNGGASYSSSRLS